MINQTKKIYREKQFSMVISLSMNHKNLHTEMLQTSCPSHSSLCSSLGGAAHTCVLTA